MCPISASHLELNVTQVVNVLVRIKKMLTLDT